MYLYSIRDCPGSLTCRHDSLLPANTSYPLHSLGVDEHPRSSEESSEDGRAEAADSVNALKLPIIYPRRKYVGVCNVETVKDGEFSKLDPFSSKFICYAVNFVGPGDNFVVSGSDDGKLTIYNVTTMSY